MCNCFLFCAELNRYFTQKIEHAKYVFRRERERKKNWQYLIVLYANEWVNNNLFNAIIHPERSLMFFVQHFTFRFLECVSLKKIRCYFMLFIPKVFFCSWFKERKMHTLPIMSFGSRMSFVFASLAMSLRTRHNVCICIYWMWNTQHSHDF